MHVFYFMHLLNCNLQSPADFRPILLASYAGQVETVKALVAAGADMNVGLNQVSCCRCESG